jgi:lipid-A-disaccharide synthase
VRELKARFPNAEFAGIGGDAMRSAGCQTWHDASELAVMGLTEVLRHLPRLLKLRSAFRQRAGMAAGRVHRHRRTRLQPGHRALAEAARRAHRALRQPSVWAWREKRAEKIGSSADLVLCLFPMEPPIYARHGIDARFVGHPMADDIPLQGNREEGAALGLPTSAKVLAVLPGSRLGEISPGRTVLRSRLAGLRAHSRPACGGAAANRPAGN